MNRFMEVLFGTPTKTGRPAGAWLAARQSAPVWGNVSSLLQQERPRLPYDWEEET
jgi:hypothetical protein